MDIFSTELGIRHSFFKTSEFRGGLNHLPQNPPRYATGSPCYCLRANSQVICSVFMLILLAIIHLENRKCPRCKAKYEDNNYVAGTAACCCCQYLDCGLSTDRDVVNMVE
jgi:hypothetical protein